MRKAKEIVDQIIDKYQGEGLSHFLHGEVFTEALESFSMDAYKEGMDHPGIAEALKKNYEAGFRTGRKEALEEAIQKAHFYTQENVCEGDSGHQVAQNIRSSIRALAKGKP